MMGGVKKHHKQQTESETTSSSFSVPLLLSKFSFFFEQNLANNTFLGTNSYYPQSDKLALRNSMMISKYNYHHEALKPSANAIEKTQFAAASFYQLAHQYLSKHLKAFPLVGKNKCLGFVSLPNSKLVMIALSQDRDPKQDIKLRKKMVKLIAQINKLSKHHVFELALLPTKEQYLALRALSLPSPMMMPPKEVIEPRTRCAEVSLMVALNKIARTKPLNPEQTCMLTFGCGLWANQKTELAIPGFNAQFRNNKYTQGYLKIELHDGSIGWLDVWQPCPNHCEPFLHNIRAMSFSGGPSSSFSGPRSEQLPFTQQNQSVPPEDGNRPVQPSSETYKLNTRL